MAYGVNAPFGLRPVSSITGGSWTEKTNVYYLESDITGEFTENLSIFCGDPMMFKTGRLPEVTRAAFDNDGLPENNNAAIVGVFQSCEYIDTTGNLVQSPYWPGGSHIQAGSAIKAYIIDDPNVVFEIQASTSTDVADNSRFGGYVGDISRSTPQSFCGQNYPFGLGGGGDNILPNNPTSGNTRTGQSGVYLNVVGTDTPDENNARVSSTFPLKAIGYSLNVNNQINVPDGTAANQFLNIRVLINNHTFKSGTEGIVQPA